MKNIFSTNASWGLFTLRVMLGLVILPHGAQKLLGWFGGYGFEGTMIYFIDTVGLPWIAGYAVILLETIGALMLVVGFGTRIISLAYIILATGIIFTTHIQNGFFQNWFGQQAGEGYEYFLLWIGMAAALAFSGAGSYSIDRVITRRYLQLEK